MSRTVIRKKHCVRRTRDFRAEAVSRKPFTPEELLAIADAVKSLAAENGVKTDSCAACGGPFDAKFVPYTKNGKRVRYSHSHLAHLAGIEKAKQVRKDLHVMWHAAGCPQKFANFCRQNGAVMMVQRVEVNPLSVGIDVCGKPVVVLVCSEECRSKIKSGNKEYDQCLVQVHDAWQQVRAIKEFLRTPSRDALSLLKPESERRQTSQVSCQQ